MPKYVKSPRVTIDGVPVKGTTRVGWSLLEGTRPYMAEFELAPGDADALVETGKKLTPVTLEMEVLDKKLKVAPLYVVKASPADNWYGKRIVLADRRWFWPYKHIRREYNKRRRVGYKRLIHIFPVELQEIEERIAYAAFSLYDRNKGLAGKWTAKQILKDVMQEVFKAEGRTPNIRFSDVAGTQKLEELPVEDFSLDDSGDKAIARVLAYVPQLGVYIDYDGSVVFFSKASGLEDVQLDSNFPELVGRGHVEFVDSSIQRPKKIRVFFTREMEIRFNYYENTAVAPMTKTLNQIDDARECDNVLDLPDFEATKQSGERVVQGTWITIDEALGLKEWHPVPYLGSLTKPLILRAMIPHMDLWSAIRLAGMLRPNEDWASRIAKLEQHFRRTFRLRRTWVDNALQWRAYRVGTVDQTSGRRAPASVFSDFCILNTQRSLIKDVLGNADMTYAINVTGFATLVGVDTLPAPFSLHVLDSDQGIIHIEPRLDWNRMYEMILPCKMKEEAMPWGNIKDASFGKGTETRKSRPLAFNQSLGSMSAVPQLAEVDFKTFILTGIPGYPNSNEQLHEIVVEPNDVKGLLPSAVAAKLGDCHGPEWEVRVGAGLETARFVWSDDPLDVKAIEACWGLNGPEGVHTYLNRLKKLCVNETDPGSDTKGAASLTAIARAVAARIYASMVDHQEGTFEGMLNPQAKILGWIQEVAHTVDPQGVGSTRLTMPEKLERLDLMAYLDNSTRAILLRLAQG